MNKNDVLKVIREHAAEIRQFGVKRLALFGSFTRGEETQSSDLDFVVEFEKKSFDAYFGLKQYLEGLFNRRVDLILPNTIKPRLREKILGELIDAA